MTATPATKARFYPTAVSIYCAAAKNLQITLSVNLIVGHGNSKQQFTIISNNAREAERLQSFFFGTNVSIWNLDNDDSASEEGEE